MDAYLAKALLERLARLEEEVRRLKNPPGFATLTTNPYTFTGNTVSYT